MQAREVLGLSYFVNVMQAAGREEAGVSASEEEQPAAGIAIAQEWTEREGVRTNPVFPDLEIGDAAVEFTRDDDLSAAVSDFAESALTDADRLRARRMPTRRTPPRSPSPSAAVDPATMTDAPPSDAVAEFVEVMRRLRVECAWKAGQTHDSLVPFLREETEELVEAIGSGNVDHVREELGDVLLQVVFHAAIAEQAGEFTLDDVARGITEKMRRRNPHVFDPVSIGRSPDDPPLDAAAIDELWERIKRSERA